MNLFNMVNSSGVKPLAIRYRILQDDKQVIYNLKKVYILSYTYILLNITQRERSIARKAKLPFSFFYFHIWA
jgi:hypothetical protein